MAKRKKTVSGNELALARIQAKAQEQRLQIIFHISRLGVSLLRRVAVVGGWCFAAWMVKDIFLGLAGKETYANIAVKLLGDITFPEWIAYGVGGAGATYGYAQARLRKKAIGEQTRHTEAIEKKIDPNRRSSMLARDGRNRKEDML